MHTEYRLRSITRRVGYEVYLVEIWDLFGIDYLDYLLCMLFLIVHEQIGHLVLVRKSMVSCFSCDV